MIDLFDRPGPRAPRGSGATDGLDFEVVADQAVKIERGAVTTDRGSLDEPGDGPHSLHTPEGAAGALADGPVDAGATAGGIHLGEEERQSLVETDAA